MFSQWKEEKALLALVDEAQALADKLAAAKPHVRDSHAAAAQFWAASYLAAGQDLQGVARWKPVAAKRFAAALQTKIAVLRKARAYDSSDGLAIWMHSARAVTEPRVAPAVRQIWHQILNASPNADAMAQDLMAEAAIAPIAGPWMPKGLGIATDDQD